MEKLFYFLLIGFLFLNNSFSNNRTEFLFDFGPDDSPVADGFVKISEKDIYSFNKGYGWKSSIPLYSRNENFSTQETFLELDPLLCDHVTGGKDFSYPEGTFSFRVDLPQGEYICALIMGKLTEKNGNTLDRPPFWYKSYSVKVNGKEIIRIEKNWKSHLTEFYSVTENDFLPNDSVFDKFISPYFKRYIFTFTSKGSLTLEFSSVCPLNALLIYPIEKKKEFQEKLSQIEKNNRSFLDSQYKIDKFEEPLSEDLIKKYEKQGYILFVRPNDVIYPGSRPREEEVNMPASNFTPQGEKSVLTFSLFPLKELKEVKITFTDLVSKEGYTIPKINLSLWLVRYNLFSLWIPRYVDTPDKNSAYYLIRPWCMIKPWALFKYDKPLNLTSRVTRAFYIYVNVPENIPSGEYQGEIKINPRNAPSSSLPLVVKVLPFKLKEPDMLLGMYAQHPRNTLYRFVKEEDSILKKECSKLMEKMFLEMKDIGFNTVSLELPWHPFKITEEGTVIQKGEFGEKTWEYWVDTLNLYKKIFGNKPLLISGIGSSCLIHPITCPGFWTRQLDEWEKYGYSEKAIANAEKLISYFYQKAKENEWPEIIFYVSDELSFLGKRGGRFGKELASIYRKIADKIGFRTCASMIGEPEYEMLPYLDIAIIHYNFPITENILEKIKKAGCELWFYNVGAHRFSYGFYLVKARPKGCLQWAFGQAFRYFDQIPSLPSLGNSVYALVLDSRLNIGKRCNIEDIRQGIIDYRYYITLESLVKENKGSSNEKLVKAIEKAEKLLSEIEDNINLDMRHYVKEGPWKAEICQKYRSMLASAIMEVLNAKSSED